MSGENATLIVDALRLLSTAKPQYAKTYLKLMRENCMQASAQAICIRDGNTSQIKVEVSHSGQRGTCRFAVNGIAVESTEFVGHLKAVFAVRDDGVLVNGGNSHRLRYLDLLNAQCDPAYLKINRRYHSILRRRDAFLRDSSRQNHKADELDFWNHRLATEGGRIVAARGAAIQTLSARLQELTGKVDGVPEMRLSYRPKLSVDSYAPQIANIDARQAAAILEKELKRARRAEKSKGMTLIGPQYDGLILVPVDRKSSPSIAGRAVAITALILRLAEAGELLARTKTTPVVVLDLPLPPLDTRILNLMARQLDGYEQIFVGATPLFKAGKQLNFRH